MAWLTGFNWRAPITANTSALTTTEVNIPLPAFLPTLTGKRLQAAWQDVNFTDVDGTTLLDWYLEIKSDTVGVAHIKVPSLTFGNAALPVGYLYTGNAAVADQSDEAGTFSSMVARYSMADVGPTTIYDSTVNDKDSTTVYNSPTFGAAGQIGNAISFASASSQWALFPVQTVLTASVSLSAWINLTVPTKGCVLSVGLAGGFGYGIGIGSGDWDTNGSSVVAVYGNVRWIAPAAPITSGWHHIALVIDASGVPTLYVDGVTSGPVAGAGPGAPATSSGIANYTGAARYFNGSVDEARVHAAQRTDSWLNAEYLAGSNSLFTFGAWEAAVSGHPALRRLGLFPTGFEFDRSRQTRWA